MIGRTEEYEKMFRLEGQLWWYRSLHDRVATSLQQLFGQHRDMAILDAGCGTGGLLEFLRRQGYTNLQGIDGSADAVTFCQQRELPVALVNLNNLAHADLLEKYDVIICNDVFCYFTDADLHPLLTGLSERLKPNGVLLSNNNAFDLFRGEHDVAVGIIRRFVRADFDRVLPQHGLSVQSAAYWSFLLSPLILLIRQWQRLQLILGWRSPEEAKSDVYLPSSWINETLYCIARTEQIRLRRTPFGSSLFIISKKL